LTLGQRHYQRRLPFQGLTQKDFATKICEKPQVVNEYESGKAVPNQVTIVITESTELTDWAFFAN
jgi:ribosome-binding protein aMBF1 (putative translation factor)